MSALAPRSIESRQSPVRPDQVAINSEKHVRFSEFERAGPVSEMGRVVASSALSLAALLDRESSQYLISEMLVKRR
jgi:hypothetical protein